MDSNSFNVLPFDEPVQIPPNLDRRSQSCFPLSIAISGAFGGCTANPNAGVFIACTADECPNLPVNCGPDGSVDTAMCSDNGPSESATGDGPTNPTVIVNNLKGSLTPFGTFALKVFLKRSTVAEYAEQHGCSKQDAREAFKIGVTELRKTCEGVFGTRLSEAVQILARELQSK